MLLLHVVALVAASPLLLTTVHSKAQRCVCSEVKRGTDYEVMTVCRSTACIPEGRPALWLQGPGVASLTRESLRGNHNLLSLTIEGSSLTGLPGNLLADARGLRYLEISYSPTLKSLPEELLQPLGRLEVLVLKNLTGLSKVPGMFLGTNTHLRRLVIQNVPGLTELHLNLPRYGNSLNELVVSGTSVENLDLQGISTAVDLTSLDLSGNHLRELPLLAEFLKETKKLGKLSLSGNMWDCSLLWQQGLLKALSGSGILFDNGAECTQPQACAGTALTSPIVQKCLTYTTQRHSSGSLSDIFASILSESADGPAGKVLPPPEAYGPPEGDLYSTAPQKGDRTTSPPPPPPPHHQDLSDSDTDALFAVLGDVLKDQPTPPPPPPHTHGPPRPPPRPFPNEDLALVLPKLEQTLKEILDSAAADLPPTVPARPSPTAPTTTPNLHDLEKTLSALLPLLRDIVRKGSITPTFPPPKVTKDGEKVAALRNLLELLQKGAHNDFADVQLLMSECEDDPGKKAERGGEREVFVNVGAIFHSHQPLCSKI